MLLLCGAAIFLPAAAQCEAAMPAAQAPAGAHPAVVRVVVEDRSGTSYGSGALVAVSGQYGLVVTNWHVVRDAAGQITVLFPDGFRSAATLVTTDRRWDLAALSIWRPSVDPLPLSSDAPRPGDVLRIAGYGKGWYREAAGRCTQYVSPGGNQPFEMVELAAAAREGDSGGPILNSRGELAGVLFGSAYGSTTGAYCGRVRQFLAPVMARLDELPDPTTMIAGAAEPRPAPLASLGPLGVRPLPKIGSSAGPARQAAPDRWSAPAETPAAAPAVGPPAVETASEDAQTPAAVANAGIALAGRPAAAGPSLAEQLKTILAWAGAVLVIFHAIRFLGWAVG